jgi:hypothetical protein
VFTSLTPNGSLAAAGNDAMRARDALRKLKLKVKPKPPPSNLLIALNYPPFFLSSSASRGGMGVPVWERLRATSVQFFLGPRFSGAPVHYHRAAWNHVVFGAKKWFLFPAPLAFYSTKPVMSWYQQDYFPALQRARASAAEDDDAERREKPALECTQRAGDVIFIPDHYAHAVINLEDTIGFAPEFIHGPI